MTASRLAALAVVLIVLAASRPAAACQCRPITEAQGRTSADVGFRGRVLTFERSATSPACDADSEQPLCVSIGSARMAVTERLKGVDSRFSLEVRTSFAWCSFGKQFEVGSEYDVWAWRRQDGSLWTNACAVRDISHGPKLGPSCAGCDVGTGDSSSFLLLLLVMVAAARRAKR